MKCVKTGVDLFLRSKNVYVHGDMFAPFYNGGLTNAQLGLKMFDLGVLEIQQRAGTIFDGVGIGVSVPVNLVVNAVYSGREPISSRLHVIAEEDDHLFNFGGAGVLFVCANKARWLGYDGMDLKTAFSL